MTSTGFSLHENNWRQLVEIGGRTWLGVETQGAGWVFGEPGKMPTVLLEDVTGAMIPLLPLLDKPYPEVLGQLSGQEDAPQLLSRLAVFALGHPNVHEKWKQRAISWLNTGCPRPQ